MEAKLKRPYAKPMIERITLVGEMMATSVCKSGANPALGKSSRGCTSAQCKSALGS